ncbi:MAG: TIM barrel protein [Roseibium sp.]
MNLGLGSYTYRWSVGHKGLVPDVPMTAMGILEVAIRHQLKVVQFADNLPLHTLPEAELNGLASRAADAGFSLELGTQSFDATQVKQYINIGKRIDAKILRVALDGPDALKPIPDLAKEFQKLIPAAKDAGIRIAIENHFNYPSPRLVKLLEAISDDQVGVCLDVANSICAGEWPMETVALLAPHTINLHLKDYVIEPDPYGVGFRIYGAPLGQGKTDCQAVLNAADYPADMSVIMEHWLPQEKDMPSAQAKEHEWLAQSIKYARSELGL